MKGFDLVAPAYDMLAHLVFGDSIRRSSACFLSGIRNTDSVLVLGGGTGKILEEIPICRGVVFVDSSQKMLTIAQRRITSLEVDFVLSDFLEFKSEKRFNMIICPFFLDCFLEKHLIGAISNIRELLAADGSLFVSDFQPGRATLLLKLMHIFFRIFASLESRELKNIHQYISDAGFSVLEEEFFYKKAIFSRVYGNL